MSATHAARPTAQTFSEHVRSTEPRSPEAERQGFTLPDGFRIELYASEPDIGKPMNIAFDAKGRLWVTQSHEYPLAAESGKGSDRITILEDTDADGRADRFIPFANTLNIPIGVLPYKDNEAIAYSIPNVYRLADTDGDGRADQQSKILGPFEHEDTHGMVNNFMRGYDGWVHACHGFTNESTVAGADGDPVHMVSGNTFRFRPDGSRVEQTTVGRINPFGLAYDELGYLYSTDCHTAPLYQLIRGGDYPQWGREEGMGFAPEMRPLGKEATALAGIAYYADEIFPEDYQSNFYVGDVVASRIYRYSFEFKGSTPIATREADFVASNDPWFRPVDVKLGPDGALYVADFYNRVIGHYEVPLGHPGRDRRRGRIWRITYEGDAHEDRPPLATADAAGLIAFLGHSNLAVRLMAADQLVDRIGAPAAAPLASALADRSLDTRTYVHALWALHRLGALDEAAVKRSAKHSEEAIRVHTMRILLEQAAPQRAFYPVIVDALEDESPHVRRAALEALVQYPDLQTLRVVLRERQRTPSYDTHLAYTARLCLRNLVREEAVITEAQTIEWNDVEAAALVDVMTGVNTREAATFLLAHVESAAAAPARTLPRLLQHTARFIPEARMDDIVKAASARTADDLPAELAALTAIRQGIGQRGGADPSALAAWGSRVAASLLEKPVACGSAPPLWSETFAREIDALELAGHYELASVEPVVVRCLEHARDTNVRLAAASALLRIDPGTHTSTITRILQDESEPIEIKRGIATSLGEVPGPVAVPILSGLRSVPSTLQGDIVRALANTAEGRKVLFDKVREGTFFARVLVEPLTAERILASSSEAEEREYKQLTANVSPVSDDKASLIWERLEGFRLANVSSEDGDGASPASPTLVRDGENVFGRNCAPCHQVGGKGGSIGPQLTGIGNWGPNALAEKILDPNRNISEAFRTYTITTKDEKALTGLFRRDEGASIVLADATGKEFSVAKANIAEQRAAPYTVMPDQFGDVLSQDQFNALLTYLLSLKN